MVSVIHGLGPTIAGTQVPVRRIYGWYTQGVSIERILKRYPQLRHAQVFAALAYAFDHRGEIEAELSRERTMLQP